MNFTPQKIAATLLVLTAVLLSSCLPEAENQTPSRILIGLEFNSIDDTVSSGEDTMTFESLQLIHGQSFIIRGQDSLLINLQAVQLRADSTRPNPQTLLSTNFPEGTYQQLNFLLPRAEQSNLNIDPIFFADDGRRFTIVLQGTYNDSSFTYRSEREYELPFEFNPDVMVPQFNEGFTFIISSDVQSWFNPGGAQGFIDPRDNENSMEINDNIGESFQLRQIEEGEEI